MQILILGMHRSGTSLATRLVNLMGAYFAPTGLALPVSSDNPRGFWERRDALEANQALLRHSGCVWFKVDSWDDHQAASLSPALRNRLQAVISELDAHQPWVLKDPRLCITLPCWLPLLKKPVAVVVWREPLEIAQSLALRNAMPPDYALALWEYHAAGIVRHGAALPKIFIRFDELVENPLMAVRNLHAQLVQSGGSGLHMPHEHDILDHVEPALRRADKTAAGLRLTSFQHELSLMLRGEKPFIAGLQPSPQARQLMQSTGHAVSGAPV